MKTRILVLSVVAAVVVSAGIAWAVGPRAGMGPGAKAGGCIWAGGAGFAGLDLTDAQTTQLREMQQAFRDATQQLRDQLQAKAKEMQRLWDAQEPDAAAIKATAAQMDMIRAEIRNVGVDYQIKAMGVLTPAQREKVRANCGNCPGFAGCGAAMLGCGPAAGQGMGMGPCGAGAGPRCGMGMGPGGGMQNATGPRAQMGTCPRAAK